MRKAFIYILIFVVVGELVIRFDKAFKVMEAARIVKISTDIELTPEYDLLKEGFFNNHLNDLKIMVIGDSYIHGGGIEFNDNFSQNLKRMVNENKGDFNNGWVLDVSKPDSNNLDNNETYFQFIDKYRPNIVILGYNINDIDGNLKKSNEDVSIKNFKEKKVAGEDDNSLIGKIYKIFKTSEFLNFTLHKAHNQLKAFGVAIPGSRFDLTLKSYSSDKENWKQSKLLLKEVIEHADEHNIQLIIYKFPEMNLIEHQDLFKESDIAIAKFFEKFSSLYFINGGAEFTGQKARDYILSKYDGHPNEKAHKKMAQDVFKLIQETNYFYK